jgi:signal transduction histidine kinase/CheY-like chemotaxis protein/HAMP domain-containing protein
MKSLGTRFLLPVAGLAVLFSMFVIYQAYTASRQHANELIGQQAALALEFNLAIRDYAGKKIRPVMEGMVGKDDFIPETMSTSFISRSIFELVRKKFPDYVIRFASDNPRNPINAANADELKMLDFFRKNPTVGRRIEEIAIAGRPYLAHFTPRWFQSECLHCHGDPKAAPAALLKQYGATASFHRKAGDLAGLDMVAIPTESVQDVLASEMRWQSQLLAAGLALLFGSVFATFRIVVTRRLTTIAGHFTAIAAQPEPSRLVPVAVTGNDEISRLGSAFNTLVGELRAAHASLEERVGLRTTELAQSNEELRREIGERRQAEAALAEQTRQLESVRAITAEITRELELPTLLRLITQRACELTGANGGELALWDERAQELISTAAYGEAEARQKITKRRLGDGVMGTVAQRREGMLVNDYRSSPFAHPVTPAHSAITAGLTEPLLYGDRLLGVLGVNHDAPGRTFLPRDQEMLKLFAAQAAIAIENARLFQQEQHRRRELEAVRAVSEEIARELDLTPLLRLVQERILQLIPVDNAAIYLWDETAKALIPKGWHGFGAWMADVRFRLGEGVTGAAAERREGIIVNEFRSSSYATPYWLEHTRHVAVLAEPLVYGERLVGVIALTRNDPGVPFTDDDQRRLRLLATQAAIAIENARLFDAQQRAFASLQRAQDELVAAAKLRALGQMAAGIAHDLNNMLAAILGQVELMKLRGGTPEIREGLETLQTAATDGADVVRRLQDFARQRVASPLAPMDLAKAVRETLEITRPRWKDEAQRRGRRIEIQESLEGLPAILGHAPEVREALTNLIFNAVDAMPDGGTLSIAGAATADGVILRVADTGIGMPDEVRQRVFEPFFTTKGVRGTGLGLSVVYGIMERHGGRIAIESAPGRGTTIVLRFQEAAPHEAEPPAAPTLQPTPRRLLLIDDDPMVRTTLANLLRAMGHAVVEAESGPAGLAALQANPVDCILTDLGMPDMTGVEVARHIKAQHPHLPVVLLTGWGEHWAGDAPEPAATDRVLGKPVKLDELLRTIAELSPPRPSDG